ncbi:hypothetical protein KDA23_06445 [Candidatus Saccharibacteria bacterium]|nr:hypothetical protein [Candidatus Saccharibacteria bacterium]
MTELFDPNEELFAGVDPEIVEEFWGERIAREPEEGAAPRKPLPGNLATMTMFGGVWTRIINAWEAGADSTTEGEQ